MLRRHRPIFFALQATFKIRKLWRKVQRCCLHMIWWIGEKSSFHSCYFRDTFRTPSPLLLSCPIHIPIWLLVAKRTSIGYLKWFFSLQKYHVNRGGSETWCAQCIPCPTLWDASPEDSVGSGNKQNISSWFVQIKLWGRHLKHLIGTVETWSTHQHTVNTAITEGTLDVFLEALPTWDMQWKSIKTVWPGGAWCMLDWCAHAG